MVVSISSKLLRWWYFLFTFAIDWLLLLCLRFDSLLLPQTLCERCILDVSYEFLQTHKKQKFCVLHCSSNENNKNIEWRNLNYRSLRFSLAIFCLLSKLFFLFRFFVVVIIQLLSLENGLVFFAWCKYNSFVFLIEVRQ